VTDDKQRDGRTAMKLLQLEAIRVSSHWYRITAALLLYTDIRQHGRIQGPQQTGHLYRTQHNFSFPFTSSACVCNVPLVTVISSTSFFPANHLTMVLTKQTYNNQDKYKKPKDIHKKPQKLNKNKTKVTLVYSPLTTSGHETDRVYCSILTKITDPGAYMGRLWVVKRLIFLFISSY